MKRIASGLAALAVIAAGAPAAAATNIWSTSFDHGAFENVGPFGSGFLFLSFGGGSFQNPESLPGFGSLFLRNDTNGTTTFGASGLDAHTALELSFDIAFIDSWDGFNGNPSPDELNIVIDGLSPLVLTSNNATGSAPAYGPGVVVSPLASYGFNPDWQDVVVHYSFVIPHTASSWSMAINFGGAGFQGGLDESWGIDNFSLAAVTGGVVPEPATWGLMIAGFGLAGAALRRRRAQLG